MFSAVLKKNESSWMAHTALAAGLVLAIAVSGWLGPFSAACASLRQDTLRLHVQANSNSEADQALKLLVRDAVLETAQTLFAGLPDQQAALETARAHLEDFQRAAERVVREEGSDQAVRVYVTNMYFPTTAYEDFTLPAGRYDALRVELGDHAGRNWFCVLYPALCLSAAQPAEYPEAAQQEILENSRGYEVRFAALEAVERLEEWLHEN
ncbi:MAG: stage II sporulation protein R [Fournierella sp.]|uniref:stage II sporulation protein R n=1 Tax=Allofournierella sp. TaxID=1940256 RepID=UPI002A832FC6|nr:stage II sporulation protein R [Fournierella sp.]MDY4166295.1 stage II sporulation protein R [Fournierella sp.]